MSKRDYYEVLGIAKDSDAKQIKKAYRTLAKEHHPDRNGGKGSDEKFKEVQEAYEVLSDDSKRKAYDQFGHAGASSFGAGYGDGANGFDGGTPFDMGDIGDILSQMFGGGGGGFDFGGFGPQGGQRGGADLRYRVRLNFMEAMGGGEYTIKVDRDVTCEHCKGSGSEDGELEKCDTCEGRGRVQRVQNTMLGQMSVVAECPDCHGRGEKPKKECKECKGEGIQRESKDVKINVPAGAYDGMRLRFRGGGSTGKHGAATGDMFIEVSVEPHNTFERRGNDIHTIEHITVYSAVLGDELEVETVVGKVKLKIPTGTQSETILRIKGKGSPIVGKDGQSGDHYVRIIVDIPKRVSKKERQAWEQLSRQ